MSDYENAYNDFTEEEWASIDAICAAAAAKSSEPQPATPTDSEYVFSPGQYVSIAHEPTIDDVSNKASTSAGESSVARPIFSPYTRFRHGYLTVTDIVSPAWCEVQYDYGLRQGRAKPIQKRAESFQTKSGKEIVVEKKVAKLNDKRTKRGKVVHKKLEKEIHPEEVTLAVKTEEERWAVRMMDTLTRLKVLKDTGHCRELPVWGYLHGQPILGIIDEIIHEAQTTYTSAQASTSASGSSDHTSDLHANQPDLTNYFPTMPKSPSKHPIHTSPALAEKVQISLLDNKTRRSNVMPSHNMTLTSRLQLMAYWHLFSDILCTASSSSDNPLNTERYWQELGLNIDYQFNSLFREQLATLAVNNGLTTTTAGLINAICLRDMVLPFWDIVKAVSSGWELTRRLRLVYHSQYTPSGLKQGKPNGCKTHEEQEAEDLEKAIRMSLLGVDVSAKTDMEESGSGSGLIDGKRILVDLSSNTEQRRDREQSSSSTSSSLKGKRKLQDHEDTPSDTSSEASHVTQSLFRDGHPLIGTKKFYYNPEFLDDHLSNVLPWWYGEREPIGVDIEETWKCNHCEYRNGCEWRESKALEDKQNLLQSPAELAQSSKEDTEKETID